MKKYQSFLSVNFQFLVVKFSIYLNRRVFVMLFWKGGCKSLKTVEFLDETRELTVLFVKHLIAWEYSCTSPSYGLFFACKTFKHRLYFYWDAPASTLDILSDCQRFPWNPNVCKKIIWFIIFLVFQIGLYKGKVCHCHSKSIAILHTTKL